MGFFGKKKNTLGLDVGSGFVKLLEVDHSGDQPEVIRVGVRSLPPEAIVEGEVMDPPWWPTRSRASRRSSAPTVRGW